MAKWWWDARKVLIVDGEMEQNELSDRLDRMDIKDNVRVISVPQLYSMYDGNFTLQNERFKDMIINEIKKHNIDIIIFDNLSSLCGNIDENTSKDFHPINSFFVLLRSMGKCVNVVHHNNKSGGQRGTVSHEDNLNTILSLDQMTTNEGLTIKLTFKKKRWACPDYRLINNVKLTLNDVDGRLTWTDGAGRSSKEDDEKINVILTMIKEGKSERKMEKELKEMGFDGVSRRNLKETLLPLIQGGGFCRKDNGTWSLTKAGEDRL